MRHLPLLLSLILLPWIAMSPSATSASPPPATVMAQSRCPDAAPDSTLVTTVADPHNPGEPWIITSFRRTDESDQAFTRRHFELVKATREALR
jgi:hypothetical protein